MGASGSTCCYQQGGAGGRLNCIEMLTRQEEGKKTGVPSNQAVEGNSIKVSGKDGVNTGSPGKVMQTMSVPQPKQSKESQSQQ